MHERERKRLLDRVYRRTRTIGRSMPEQVTVNDEKIPVRAFLFELSNQSELGDRDRERVDEVVRLLRRERLRLVQRVENDPIDVETGEMLADRIHELDRAIAAFDTIEGPSIGERVRQQEIESAQELIDMMRAFGKK